MLDVLRKNASSWMIKALLGLIALVFIFFFGSSTLRGPQDNTSIAAKVNGDVITGHQIDGFYRLLQAFNPVYRNLPDQFQEQVRQSALAVLIERDITGKEALNLGLRVPDKEVGRNITADPEKWEYPEDTYMLKDPSLWKEGRFDTTLYQERFRPWYLNRFGEDYESWIKNELLYAKLKKLFYHLTYVSENLTGENNDLAGREIRLTRVRLTPIAVKTENQGGETPAMSLDELYAVFKETGSLKNIDKASAHNWEWNESEIPLTSLTRWQVFMDGYFDVDIITGLYRLDKQNPYLDGPVMDGETAYFFKLLDKKEPTHVENQTVEPTDRRLVFSRYFYDRWYDEKLEQSKITVNQ